LPNGGHVKTGRFSLALFPWRFSPGATRRCPVRRPRATRPSPRLAAPGRRMTTWRAGESCGGGELWRLATGSWIKTRRFRCRADVNRLMILLRLSVGRCAFFARFLRPVVEALVLAMLDIHAHPGPGCAIRAGLVGDHYARRAGWLSHQLAQELLRCAPAPAALNQGAGNQAATNRPHRRRKHATASCR
jgi:hypothetical protein